MVQLPQGGSALLSSQKITKAGKQLVFECFSYLKSLQQVQIRLRIGWRHASSLQILQWPIWAMGLSSSFTVRHYYGLMFSYRKLGGYKNPANWRQTWNLSRLHGYYPCKILFHWGKIQLSTYAGALMYGFDNLVWV